MNLKNYFSLLIVLFLYNVGVAQSVYRTDIEISEQASIALSNYQVDLTINTADLVTQGKMNANGSDLRFYSDSCLTTTLNHWVESGINTPTTIVWVLVPSIPANTVTTIYMGYGDPLAAITSNFAATFPTAIISGGAPLNLTGNIVTDWFQLDGGDILTLTNEAPLSINARKIIINGTVIGNGAGFAGGAAGSGVGNIGAGPGGGTTSNPMNSGCGGGSYGGVGGTGGFDLGDSPGIGGAINGTDSGTDFNMGSGGAASDINFGGAGGGAFAMNAEYITVTGTINMDGASAQQPGGGRGAGGGSGGSVIAIGRELFIGGTITANGGGGSIGTSTANDDGGSGSGGRIKFFYTGSITNIATISVVGGPVGTFGTGGAPTMGGSGVVFDGALIALDDLVININPELDLNFTATISGNSAACEGDNVTLSAGGNYTSYLWSTGETASSINVIVDGTYELTAESPFGCGIFDLVDITVAFNSLPVLDLVTDTVFCETSTIILDAGSGFDTYVWSNGDLTQTTAINASGVYTVTVTNTDGCANSGSINVTENPLPILSFTDTSFCATSSVVLDAGAGFDTYSWSNGDPTQTTTINAAGVYSVTVTNADGCENSAFINVIENPLPVLSATSLDEILGNDGAIDLTVTGGTPGFTYVWNNGAGSIEDPTGLAGNDYTVIVTDSEGCSATTTVTVDSQVGLDELTAAFKLFPNPTSGVFTIQPEQAFEGMTGTIYDNAGRIVQSIVFNGMQAISIDLSSKENGVYSLIMNANNETVNVRIVVQ